MRAQLREGLGVMSSDGVKVGTVKEVRAQDLLVIRPLGSNLYVPIDDVADIAADRLVLDVSADQVNKMRWEHPSAERPAA
ncbi:MAG: DUF2171 domain-containing protein [Chloroflexi bacterium]|nr:DUF2171 domain-containing protein [Chloroflexota bacterium]